jgi:hypothetical protein
MDLDADTGGHSLQAAFSTGYVAEAARALLENGAGPAPVVRFRCMLR